MASSGNEHVPNDPQTTGPVPPPYPTQDPAYPYPAPSAPNSGQYQAPNSAPYPPQNTTAPYPPQNTTAPYPPQNTTASYPPQNTTAPYPPQSTTAPYPPQNTAPDPAYPPQNTEPLGPPPPYPGFSQGFQQPYTVQTSAESKYPPPGQPQHPSVLHVNTVSQAPANVTIVRSVQVDAGPQPDSYLVCSILSTFFCCLIFGIIAIIYSSQVSAHWAQGRYNDSRRASAQARGWNIAAVTTGLIIIGFNIIRVYAFI